VRPNHLNHGSPMPQASFAVSGGRCAAGAWFLGMKAVIAGAGAAGLLHALALRAAGVRIEALYDPDALRARALADLVGGVIAPSLEALASTEAEIASVCSPPAVHVAQAEVLARGRLAVFVEKPVATTPGELERLAAIPRCVPVLQWRAGRGIRAIRRAVAHGELGPAPVASVDLAWARDDEYLHARSGWGCGALLSIGIHALDVLVWTLGAPIEAVTGIASRRQGATHETSAVVLLGFRGGATAALRLSVDGGADATRITLCGRGVTASIEGGEADPTASAVRWSTSDDRARRRLEALEQDTPGALGAPLLVPYVGEAVAALRRGDGERLPTVATVASTAEAHLAAMWVASRADGRARAA
jgi:predicted dehydrogenase